MEEKLLDIVSLKNGLTLEFYDASKPVAGDRWLVSMVARVEVEVKPEYLMALDATDALLNDIRAVVGDNTAYRHEKVRHFIAETEKDEVLEGLKQRFLDANLKYLSSPDFPRKLILKKYQEAQGLSLSWKS